MEGFVVLDTENKVAIGNKPNLQKATKASFANAARQKLGDISNLPQQARALTRDDKFQSISISSNEYINQLQKENKALLKSIEERNKLIEVTMVELKKLRINLQKMQQQNVQLAQSNSQMLAELNSGKDRLKALQHELGCQNGLLKAKNLEIQENLKVKNCKILHDEVKNTTNNDSAKDFKVDMEDDLLGNTKRRSQSKSLGSYQQVGSKDRNDNKRPCTRRQSAKFERGELQPAEELFPNEDIRTSEYHPSNDSLQENGSNPESIPFKDEMKEGSDALRDEAKNESWPCARRRSARLNPEEPKTCEELLEIPEAEVSVCLERDDEVQANDLNSTCSLNNEEKEGISAPVQEVQDFRRCSLSRPSRQAAKKVQTYKEVPLNKKMRRTE